MKYRVLLTLVISCLLPAVAATAKKGRRAPARKTTAAKAPAKPAIKRRAAPAKRTYGGPWTSPTKADVTLNDAVDGEDLDVRRAAVAALDGYNGAVVVSDPNTGRVLTIVNQPLAFKSGFIPCSTIKIVATLAAMSEGICDRNTILRLGRRSQMDLTMALAKSNNTYFANLGNKLGFNKVSHYAKLFGLGERAGYNIHGEAAGELPERTPAGGVGMMTSFGQGIMMTPLELASLMGAIANGGTLYYLQYPHNQDEVTAFEPRIKRELEIAPYLDDIKAGMRGAVEYGTARRANLDQAESIFGKTGTCTDFRSSTHMGWFGSFNQGERKLVVVVMLTGGNRYVNGPLASQVAGGVYRNLSRGNFFTAANGGALLSSGACCSR